MKSVQLVFLDEKGKEKVREEFRVIFSEKWPGLPAEDRALSDKIEKKHWDMYGPQKAEEFIKKQGNLTLAALRKLKMLYKWTDPEEMFDYVGVLKRVERSEASFCNLEDHPISLVLKIWESVAKAGNIPPQEIETFVEVIDHFKRPMPPCYIEEREDSISAHLSNVLSGGFQGSEIKVDEKWGKHPQPTPSLKPEFCYLEEFDSKILELGKIQVSGLAQATQELK